MILCQQDLQQLLVPLMMVNTSSVFFHSFLISLFIHSLYFADDKALRKHFLCLKIQSSKTAASAVCDVVLVNKTKGEQAPPGYHLIT